MYILNFIIVLFLDQLQSIQIQEVIRFKVPIEFKILDEISFSVFTVFKI